MSLVVAVVGLLYRFSIIIPPLAMAAILAYVITPLVDSLAQRLPVPRTAVVAVVYLLLAGLLIGLPFVLVPLAANQVRGIEAGVKDILARYTTFRRAVIVLGNLQIDVGTLIDRLTTPLTDSINRLIGESAAIVGGIVEFFISTIIVLIGSFYLVRDGERFHGMVENLVPPDYRDDYRRLRDEIARVWAAFFRGQIVLALVVATIFWAVGSLIGISFPVGMAVLAGALEFLPSLGHTIWLIVALTFALTQGSTWLPVQNWVFALIILGLHIIFQQVDWNLLIPRIIGSRMRLHPLVVIIGIVVGASLGGVLGIALAAPTIASLRVLGRYTYAGLLDLDPFGPPSPQTPEKEGGDNAH